MLKDTVQIKENKYVPEPMGQLETIFFREWCAAGDGHVALEARAELLHRELGIDQNHALDIQYSVAHTPYSVAHTPYTSFEEGIRHYFSLIQNEGVEIDVEYLTQLTQGVETLDFLDYHMTIDLITSYETLKYCHLHQTKSSPKLTEAMKLKAKGFWFTHLALAAEKSVPKIADEYWQTAQNWFTQAYHELNLVYASGL